jgi:integrase/recombinase XerD
MGLIEKSIPFDYRVRRKNGKLRTVLSQEKIRKLTDPAQNLKHRLIAMTTYSAELRDGEVAALKPDHIESKNMLIKVENAIGAKERYSVRSSGLLKELRHTTKPANPNASPPHPPIRISHTRGSLALHT